MSQWRNIRPQETFFFSSFASVHCSQRGKKYSSPNNRLRKPRGRGIALLICDLGARSGWVVNTTPRPLYPREKPGTHCTGGWVGPRAGLDVSDKSLSYRDSIPGPSRANVSSVAQICPDVQHQYLCHPVTWTLIWDSNPGNPKYKTGIPTCQRNGDKWKMLGEQQRLSGQIYRKVASSVTGTERFRR
jgi:hypothetical protein